MLDNSNFYPICCKYKDNDHYLLYIMNDVDKLCLANEGLALFESREALSEFAKNNNFYPYHSEDLTIFDLNYIEHFQSMSVSDNFESKLLIDIWNLLDDLCYSVPIDTREFVKCSEDNRELHQKLMFEIDLLGEKGRKQVWKKEELNIIKDVFRKGLSVFDLAIREAG